MPDHELYELHSRIGRIEGQMQAHAGRVQDMDDKFTAEIKELKASLKDDFENFGERLEKSLHSTLDGIGKKLDDQTVEMGKQGAAIAELEFDKKAKAKLIAWVAAASASIAAVAGGAVAAWPYIVEVAKHIARA